MIIFILSVFLTHGHAYEYTNRMDRKDFSFFPVNVGEDRGSETDLRSPLKHDDPIRIRAWTEGPSAGALVAASKCCASRRYSINLFTVRTAYKHV